MVEPITLRGVTKRYGPVTALEDVDLVVRPGERHGLLGPNGSGKTTLLDLLVGLTDPSSGRVDRPDASIGCSFQTPTVYPDLTVAENLGVFERGSGPVEPAWRERLVETLSLSTVAHRRAGALSDGWLKKLDVALGLLERPAYGLLDEPLDALDDVTKRRLLSLLSAYPDESHGLLVATHNPQQFGDRLDRVTIVDRGTVRYDGEVPADRSVRSLYRWALES